MPISPDQFPRDELAAKAASATVQVSFAYKNSPVDWAFKRLPLHGDLQAAFQARIEASAKELRDVRVGRTYDPEWELASHEFFFLENDPPAGGNFFSTLTDFATAPDFRSEFASGRRTLGS